MRGETTLLEQMIRAGRLDRSFYDELVFDDYATGNAVLVVAAVSAIPALLLIAGFGSSSVDFSDGFNLLLANVFRGIIRWLLTSVAVWAMATKVFDHDTARIPTTARLVGFAYVAFLPSALLASGMWNGDLASLALLASMLWFFLGLRTIAQTLFDLEPQHSAATAVVGVAVWWLLAVLRF